MKKMAGYLLRRFPRHLVPNRMTVRDVTSREGLPDGLPEDVLVELVSRRLGRQVERISHEHLSNWKPTGAYRVFVSSGSGRPWSLIYKNADYALDSVPAQADLPIVLGEPEYRILSRAHGPLESFIPEVYWHHHEVNTQRYRYLMEDLRRRWYRPTTPGDLLAAAGVIPALHAALRECGAAEQMSDLMRYDATYSQSLRGYVVGNVDQYLQAHEGSRAAELWRHWPQIAAIHEGAAPGAEVATQPIHGDYNAWNMYLNWRDRRRLKAVDWEWAGLGLPHVDLASVLKHAPGDVQAQGVEAYAAADPQLSPSDHRRTYLWCRMQDAIRDAGYVAAQLYDFAHVPRAEPTRYIAASLNRAIGAARALESDDPIRTGS